jgi:hypothetical protein
LERLIIYSLEFNVPLKDLYTKEEGAQSDLKFKKQL